MDKKPTREMIREFSLAFGRTVNAEYTGLSVSDRLLLGSLLLEEVIEYCTKGLGLSLRLENTTDGGGIKTVKTGLTHEKGLEIHRLAPGWFYDSDSDLGGTIGLFPEEGAREDPVEVVDGLADVIVVAHFNAHWHGFNLDRATEIVNESNMSKLDDNGKPIINQCKHASLDESCQFSVMDLGGPCVKDSHLIDQSKPRGKILKSANFFEPSAKLEDLIQNGDNLPESN